MTKCPLCPNAADTRIQIKRLRGLVTTVNEHLMCRQCAEVIEAWVVAVPRADERALLATITAIRDRLGAPEPVNMAPRFTADDLLDAHEALANHKGDVARLFS